MIGVDILLINICFWDYEDIVVNVIGFFSYVVGCYNYVGFLRLCDLFKDVSLWLGICWLNWSDYNFIEVMGCYWRILLYIDFVLIWVIFLF